MKTFILLTILTIKILFFQGILNANNSEKWIVQNFNTNLINIRNADGKFYAYIVLLFNENPHFVNLIQEGTISLKQMQSKNFNIKAYQNFLKKTSNKNRKTLARTILDIYFNPQRYKKNDLNKISSILEGHKIILKFTKENTADNKIQLDYCIFGTKRLLETKHPFLEINEKIYNILPLIYYDEFSTSNSTFYFDMIYINPDEVKNDYLITKKILNNQKVNSMLFVGSRVSEDIEYCLLKAFKNNSNNIEKEIWRLFEVHELTHKILNNKFNFFEQAIGEELSLSSTIYTNPYLGLAVLYSYLDYNIVNPHYIGALNYIKYIAKEKNNSDYLANPSLIKYIPKKELIRLTSLHFASKIKKLNN